MNDVKIKVYLERLLDNYNLEYTNGRVYLRDIVLYILENDITLVSIRIKDICDIIGKKYNKNGQAVERSLRYLIKDLKNEDFRITNKKFVVEICTKVVRHFNLGN